MPPLSLRSHLALVVLGAVLPGALLTGLLVWRSLEDSRNVIEHRLVDAARVDAEALDREFDATIRVLETLAESPLLDSADISRFRDEAERAVRVQNGWYAVILLTPDGQQVMHSRVAAGESLPRVTEPKSLAEVIRTGKPVVGGLTPGQRDPRVRFPVRVPVQRNGRLVYVLTAVVEPDALSALVRTQLPETEEWTRAIIDPGFLIAARSRGGDRYVGQPVPQQSLARVQNPPATPSAGTSLEGEALYSTIRRTAYGWTTAVSVPVDVLDGPVRTSIAATVVGCAVLFLGGLLSVLLVSRRVARDFADAQTAAAALAEGEPPPRSAVRVAEGQQLQDSLLRAARLLHDRAAERDEQLQRAVAAQAQAEEASRTKDQFLAILGHELRNPLAPALTALELMKLRGGNTLQREREVLERQISHMTRLVDDLLDISRLTRGKVELMVRRFELRAAVDRAADMARPLIRQCRHELTIDVPDAGLAVDGDEDRIVQTIVNLLTNAARYTPEGGHLRIVGRAHDGTIELCCEDDGPGIAEDLLPTIFEPFAQGPRAIDRHQGGLGLGLALARSLTELHHGTLTFERVAPHGSRFVMRLPRATAAPAPDGTDDQQSMTAATPRRILLVEDNADGRAMMEAALQAAGHEVETAADGVTALAAATASKPEVVILDIGLPGMNGYDVARSLRARFPSMCLIALTGYGQSSDAQAAEDAGFDAHCTKPVTIAELLREIEAVARSVRM